MDETNDSLGRHVTNVVVRTMVEDWSGETFLLNCEVLEKVSR